MELKIRNTRNATQWVDDLLNGAIELGISDLQIRLNRDDELLTVRARVNRVMEDVALARGSLALEVTNRIKTAAKIPTGPAQSIEDGLYEHDTGISRHDLRVALFPSVDGEALALRLPAKQEMPTLADIGFNDANKIRLTALLGMANGLLLLAGPMGAGKTTTMYAVLGQIGGSQRNVFTVEDPVERVVPGAVQIQINDRSRNGWPAVLRGIRRSDTEVLMIGEIRNQEQANAALEIGNAGAKVVSSIHANDSVGAVHQLLELSGSSPRMLGNQLRGVVSQRLIRTLHTDCAGAGCGICDGSGYRGVRAIHEVLIVDDALVQELVEGASAARLRDVAHESGMQTLREAADLLVAEGLTDQREVTRVLGIEPTNDITDTPDEELTTDERAAVDPAPADPNHAEARAAAAGSGDPADDFAADSDAGDHGAVADQADPDDPDHAAVHRRVELAGENGGVELEPLPLPLPARA